MNCYAAVHHHHFLRGAKERERGAAVLALILGRLICRLCVCGHKMNMQGLCNPLPESLPLCISLSAYYRNPDGLQHASDLPEFHCISKLLLRRSHSKRRWAVHHSLLDVPFLWRTEHFISTSVWWQSTKQSTIGEQKKNKKTELWVARILKVAGKHCTWLDGKARKFPKRVFMCFGSSQCFGDKGWCDHCCQSIRYSTYQRIIT